MLYVVYDLLTDYMLYPVEILENCDTYNAAAKREKEIFCLVLNLTGVLVRANALKNKIDSSIMEILKFYKKKKKTSEEVIILSTPTPAVFDTQINIEKTNISTNVLPELDHDNSISTENISNKVTVDKVKQASNFRRRLFNAMMEYNNNYENIESRNQDDINNTSLNSGVEVLPPVKTTSMSNNLVSCLDNNEIDKVTYHKYKIEKPVRDVTYGRNNVSKLDDDFLILFPILNIDCLKNIEEKIKNEEEFKLNLNNLVISIDGTDVKNFVKCTAIRLFSNDLSSKCSWYDHKNNFKLQNLGIISIMKDIVFEANIKEWFRHGAQCLKKMKSICNMSKRNFERIIKSDKCSAYSNIVNITTATPVKQNNTIIFNNINDSSTTQILASTNVSSNKSQTYVCSNFNSTSNSTSNLLTNTSVPNNSNYVIPNKLSLEEKLKNIIIKYHVSHNFVNELLEILRCEGLKLPKDVRTLLRTPINHDIIVMDPDVCDAPAKAIILNVKRNNEVSSKLISLKPYLPSEFNRLPRSLEDLGYWKATEFRTFLLYTGIIALKGRLKKQLFQHFMLFHSAIRFLLSKETCLTLNGQAKRLLTQFVTEYSDLKKFSF
ncbi:Uncharacterized protein FWK35_00015296 [Aphis craccivora]|uniref:DUF4806 domain-containing protein n=1 Tax=Aphis craccivora TaxID=307492 RepID=A0A6G0YGH5_APHCR|nr:Uncharacterized protein FWK35_00015296 [Aphis craccivora]